MAEYEFAWVKRETCGCVVAVTCEDGQGRFAQDLANWHRGKLAVERVPIAVAREELGKTFKRLEAGGYKGAGHPRGACSQPQIPAAMSAEP